MTSPQSAPTASDPRRVLILGAAGRDFHNFNVVHRDDPSVRVLAFTAAQIPGIAGRRYPAELAGDLYPEGIPIVDEAEFERVFRGEAVDEVVFAYSDVPHEHVMHIASRALAMGADFSLLGPNTTMLKSRRPVIAVTALRTGSGKSQVARWLSHDLRARGKRVAVLRHPMPYGDLVAERVQRFATMVDLDRAGVTAEEREEYEPHIAAGQIVYAGVDYASILAAAEADADIVVWDGGNNDFSFIRPDLNIAVADALRPDQVVTHHPGETVARMADIIVVNKVDVAPAEHVNALIERLRSVNPAAAVVRAASPVRLDDPSAVSGRRVLIVEDGPTITHGGMAYGAGFVAAKAAGAAAIIDPRQSAAPEIRKIYERYLHIGPVLPAVGYSAEQLSALEATINAADADVLVAATPINLEHLMKVKMPVIRARYEFMEAGSPTLTSLLDAFFDQL
jgi:predicted GTPase